MSGQIISRDLKKFIKEQIHSVFSLEVLLFLHGKQNRSFTASQIANRLGIEVDVAQRQLSELRSADLVATPRGVRSKYRYDPADKERASMVDQLSAAYTRQRVPILSLILAEHPNRVRGFAEAYRIIDRQDH